MLSTREFKAFLLYKKLILPIETWEKPQRQDNWPFQFYNQPISILESESRPMEFYAWCTFGHAIIDDYIVLDGDFS